MSIEKEYKYLVDIQLLKELEHIMIVDLDMYDYIEQYYVDQNPDHTERYRRTEYSYEYIEWTHTVKGRKDENGSGTEVEHTVQYTPTVEQAIRNKPMVRKRRYKVTYNDDPSMVWEIDYFIDHDLWVAEVEHNSGDHIQLPFWVLKDVTNDFRYSNSNLAVVK